MITIELPYFGGCPSRRHAWTGLGLVLAETGVDATVRLGDIEARSESELTDLAGSSTIRIDGVQPCEHARDRLRTHLADVQQRLRDLHALERELELRSARAEANPEPECDDGCVYLTRILEARPSGERA